jgi:hypothetical protein
MKTLKFLKFFENFIILKFFENVEILGNFLIFRNFRKKKYCMGVTIISNIRAILLLVLL